MISDSVDDISGPIGFGHNTVERFPGFAQIRRLHNRASNFTMTRTVQPELFAMSIVRSPAKLGRREGRLGQHIHPDALHSPQCMPQKFGSQSDLMAT